MSPKLVDIYIESFLFHDILNVFQVNGSRVLSRRWDGRSRTESLTDGGRSPLLQLTYNDEGKPSSLSLGNQLTTINFTYDK